MKIIVQRVTKADVTVLNKVVGKINQGMVIFVGYHLNDSFKDNDWMIKKILALRIFDDQDGNINDSIIDIKGEVLLISQFTLYADVKNGNRPSFSNSLNRDEAEKLYNDLITKLAAHIKLETGVFGANMKVSLCNDGPLTLIVESPPNN